MTRSIPVRTVATTGEPPKRRGFYALVQYCPDHTRMEAANVALVLVEMGPSSMVMHQSTATWTAARRFFGDDLDVVRLGAMLRMTLKRLMFALAENPAAQTIDRFARAEGNAFTVTPARPCVFEDATAEMDAMFVTLVEDCPLRVAVTRRICSSHYCPVCEQNIETLDGNCPGPACGGGTYDARSDRPNAAERSRVDTARDFDVKTRAVHAALHAATESSCLSGERQRQPLWTSDLSVMCSDGFVHEAWRVLDARMRALFAANPRCENAPFLNFTTSPSAPPTTKYHVWAQSLKYGTRPSILLSFGTRVDVGPETVWQDVLKHIKAAGFNDPTPEPKSFPDIYSLSKSANGIAPGPDEAFRVFLLNPTPENLWIMHQVLGEEAAPLLRKLLTQGLKYDDGAREQCSVCGGEAGEAHVCGGVHYRDSQLAKELAQEERDVLAVIDQRDALEEQIRQIHDALGVCTREWSNTHDLGQCAIESAADLRAENVRLKGSPDDGLLLRLAYEVRTATYDATAKAVLQERGRSWDAMLAEVDVPAIVRRVKR
jgi:hypothetical protein